MQAVMHATNTRIKSPPRRRFILKRMKEAVSGHGLTETQAPYVAKWRD
jgi:hypothetical protein